MCLSCMHMCLWVLVEPVKGGRHPSLGLQITVSCLFSKSSEHCYLPELSVLPVPRGCILFVVVQVVLLRLCIDETWWIKTHTHPPQSSFVIWVDSSFTLTLPQGDFQILEYLNIPHLDVQKYNLHQYKFITFSACHGFWVKLHWINNDTIYCFGLYITMYMFFLSLPLLYFTVVDCKFQMPFLW